MATKEKVLTPWCNLIDKFTTKEKLHFPFMKLVLENIKFCREHTRMDWIAPRIFKTRGLRKKCSTTLNPEL